MDFYNKLQCNMHTRHCLYFTPVNVALGLANIATGRGRRRTHMHSC